MSAKFSQTTSDFLSWDQNLNLLRKLSSDGDYKIALLVAAGSFWGLRIGDILQLQFDQILDKDDFEIVERKTKKSRKIKINSQLKRFIEDCYKNMSPQSIDSKIFISQKGTVYSIQRINVIFKKLKSRYNLKIDNYSTHSMRKTFGREVFSQSGQNAELALVKLSQIFHHSNPAITRRYLGISQQELMDMYDTLSF